MLVVFDEDSTSGEYWMGERSVFGQRVFRDFGIRVGVGVGECKSAFVVQQYQQLVGDLYGNVFAAASGAGPNGTATLCIDTENVTRLATRHSKQAVSLDQWR